MTLTSYTQSAAFIWTNQCVETGSSAFAIPALSCYIIIVTAAIVGIWVVCLPIVVDRNLRNNLLLPLSLVTSDLAIKVIVGVPLDIETFLYTTSEFMGNLHARYGSQYSSPRFPTSSWTIFLLLCVSRTLTILWSTFVVLFLWHVSEHWLPFWSFLFSSIAFSLLQFPRWAGEMPLVRNLYFWRCLEVSLHQSLHFTYNFLNFFLLSIITNGIHIKIYGIAPKRKRTSQAP